MRILYLVGGNDVVAGGATVRDSAFVRGLQNGGHDVIPVSLYGPAAAEGESGFSKLFHPLGPDGDFMCGWRRSPMGSLI